MYRPGDTIDQYRLLDAIGAGSYGMVFAAENQLSRQRVALKLVPLCGRAGAREQHALHRYHDLNHPNLLKVHHCGIAGDYLYYTMDLAEGSLASRHLSSAELRRAAVKLADALAFLHAAKLIHRDIKPDNLFFLHGEPLLGDIGLLTDNEGASLSGTPGFLLPAVRSGGTAPSELSDLYALAKSFYCLLSGLSPDEYPQYHGPYDPDASILLKTVFSVCDGEKEISSAAAFRDRLSVGKTPETGKKKLMRLAGAALLFFAAAVGAWFLFPAAKPPETPPAAERFSPAEKEAITRQQQTYEKLRDEAARQAGQAYPHREKTGMQYELARQDFQSELLTAAMAKEAAENPEFRCFYLLYGEIEPFIKELRAGKRPKQMAPRDWEKLQTLYAEYCREKERLLSCP